MPKYNDFDLDLQNLSASTSLSVKLTEFDCRASYDFGKCLTVGFGCLTNADDCGGASLSFCCQ